MVNSVQIKSLKERIDKLFVYLSIDEKKRKIHENELKAQDPQFWDDPKKAEIVLKENRQLKFWVDSTTSLKQKTEDLEVLIEFYNDGAGSVEEIDSLQESIITELEELELKNMLSGEEDSLNAVFKLLQVQEVQKVVIGRICSCECT